jgi:hypothetical protein
MERLAGGPGGPAQEAWSRKRVRLGAFARSSLEELAAKRGIGVWPLLRHAVAYYLADGDCGRHGWQPPRFRSDDRGGTTELELPLPRKEWEVLADVASRRGLDLDHLIEHALLYYLADLESGRVAARIFALLDDEPENPGPLSR